MHSRFSFRPALAVRAAPNKTGCLYDRAAATKPAAPPQLRLPSLGRQFCRAAPLMIAALLSAIMMVGALVLVEVTAGITEASMTRKPSMPCTRNSLSTTLIGCEPIIQVELA